MNIAQVFAETSRRNPDNTMFIIGDTEYSFGQIEILSNRFARGLSSMGIAKGDVVTLGLPNGPEFIIALLGIAKAGAVVLPLNPALKQKELSFIFDDCAVRCSVTFDAHAKIIGSLKGQKHQGFFMVGLSKDELGIHATISELASDKFQGQNDPVDVSPEDLFLIVYTSGTTGQPKGVMLGHDNALAVAGAVARCHGGFQQDDRYVCFFPLTHITGIINFLVNVFITGASMVLLERYELKCYLDSFHKYRATVMGAVTPVFRDVLSVADLEHYDFGSLKRITSGGASLPTSLYRDLKNRFNVPILEMYGMTENAATLTSNSLGLQKVGSVGQVLDGMAIKIVGEGGDELPSGEVGEIVAQGRGIMKGYFNRPRLTRKALVDGWYHTGDLGKVDEDGFLYIADRKDDMINTGAFKVYPREVEEAILGDRRVADCAVVSQEDERMGQIPVAFVVKNAGISLTIDDLKIFSRNVMANYKVPKYFYFVDELPRNSLGKVLKRRLLDC